jgi:anti-anti-sigma factor
MATRSVADRLVLSPQEPLVAGGPAEAFESQLRQLYRSGQRHLVIDFKRVPTIDSAGIRALVRGHTTAQRVEGTLRLAALPSRVRDMLDASRLASVFDIYESIEAARIASWPWRTIRITLFGVVLCGTLV